jgi:hypothetical protein
MNPGNIAIDAFRSVRADLLMQSTMPDVIRPTNR